MMLQDELLEFRERARAGLEYDKDFASVFELTFPPVMGFDAGDEIGAGDQAGLKGQLSQLSGGFAIGSRNQNEGEGAGGFHGGEASLGALGVERTEPAGGGGGSGVVAETCRQLSGISFTYQAPHWGLSRFVATSQ